MIDSIFSPSTVNIAAFLIVLMVAINDAEQEHCDSVVMYWAGVWGIVGALFGAEITAALIYTNNGTKQTLFTILTLQGKMSVFGAFIGAALSAGTYLRLRGEPFFKYADVSVAAISLGYAVSRIACFLAGDDFGASTDIPLAVTFGAGTEAYITHLQRGWIPPTATESMPVHPVQIYLSVVGLVGFFVMRKLRHGIPGKRLAVAFVYYGIARCLLQFLRDDHGDILFAFDPAQWICLCFIGIGGLIYMFAIYPKPQRHARICES